MATTPSRPARIVKRIRAWPRYVLVTLSVLIVLLVAARVALPYVVQRLVNDRLQRIPGYTGYVNNVGIHLWRGAYSMDGFGIFKQNEKVREPFFLARHIDFAIAWRELFRGKIVSDVIVEQGQLSFVKGPTAETTQADLDRRWQEVIQDIFPIDITHFEITDGLLRYVDTSTTPKVDVFIRNMQASATGLRNRPGEGEGGEFPAEIRVEGDSLGGGRLKLMLNAEPLALEPHFHLSVKLDNVDLPALNETLKAYANVDVGRGTFRLAGEMAGRDGGFQGYVKPFFENLDFHNIEDKDKGIGHAIWERIVAAAAWIVKNKSRDQVATRIPFEGRFGDSKVGVFATIANLFRHGFVRAFNPTVEGSLHADKILPNGKSADGKGVEAPPPDDTPAGKKQPTEPTAGAATGRTTAPAAHPPKGIEP